MARSSSRKPVKKKVAGDKLKTSPQLRQQNMPSPTSTSDDSDDEIEKCSSLDQSFNDDGTPKKPAKFASLSPTTKNKRLSSPTLLSVTKIALSVLVLLLATAAGVYLTLAASDATFAEMHSNTNGKNPVLRYLAHGEIRAREKKQEEAHHTIFTEKKSKHVHNDTLPPASLTKASSSSRGVINWSLSGKDAQGLPRSLMLFLSSPESEETRSFKASANKFGFVFGTPETAGQTYWTGESPVPSDTGSIQNVIKSVSSILESQSKGSVDKSKVFVAAKPTNFGIIVYNVDVYKSHWEEVHIPAKFGGNWDDTLTWLH